VHPAKQLRPDIQFHREHFKQRVEAIDRNRLIFLDESGVHCGMSRLYGRAFRKNRAKGDAHFHPGQRTTLIGALSGRGFKASLFGPWYMDGSIFLTFIQKSLAPTLTPGDVVIVDNLSAHKVKGVREAIEATGARLLYLPPYLPDLSPIEFAWSKINSLRTATIMTPKKLHRAICQAFRAFRIPIS
jgi:transposase